VSAHPWRHPAAGERFDNLVREDMFKGFKGDAAAFARAMATCEAALAKDPHYLPALAWHGSGLLVRGQTALSRGDSAGLADYQQGLAELNQAVALAPDDLQAVIPRAATFQASATFDPDPRRAEGLLKTAAGDCEHVLAIEEQAGGCPSFPFTPKASSLALADIYAGLGDDQPSRRYLSRRVEDLPGSSYADNAAERLADDKSRSRITCLGCHLK
jgi:tetratricopeptide (TPR) repeat protein